ncbi:DNA-directed RNA polymerase specialized sigma24 family protein [Crossiella cryophila]|uniref:DNA-directed RNA polymerase specialized sigma24 family protein n=2 Tax=Crossiella cryophila TaxID=43355 RepID=A0A7W7CIH7_9PSEU|nr:DNA-directed RNA polymerase specialized sigma24 family protein [Crossiella cryophila]
MRNDQERFTQLYQTLCPRVLAYALHRVPPDTAHDAAAETFLIAWRRRADLPYGERERDTLMHIVWDGLTTRQAAHVVGCSVTAFTVRLHRARRRFADALDRADGPNPLQEATVLTEGTRAR